MTRNRLPLCATVLTIGVCIAGCFEDDAVWTPDSTGFVYLRDDGSLMHMVVRTRQSRVLASLDCQLRRGPLERPAISPPGDRVAVVRHLVEGSRQRAQVVIFDMQGTEVHRSSLFQLPDCQEHRGGSVVWLGRAHWSPDGRRILCWLDGTQPSVALGADNAETTDSGVLCLYDLTTGKLRVYHRLKECLMTALFGASPFCPDNRGFLADRKDVPAGDDGMQSLVFVDWSGSQHQFHVSSSVSRALQQMLQDELRNEDASQVDHLTPPWWDQTRLIVPRYRGNLIVDTAARSISYQPNGHVAQVWRYAESAGAMVAEMANGVLLQVRSVQSEAGARDELTVATRNTGDERRKRVAVRTVDSVEGLVLSPDRQFALIYYVDDDQPGRLVVDSAGKVWADVK